ncbi:hypothetical protein OU787_17370 [Kitasatospora sp. YST-16]|uniref:hypothetical protein n=1 Tax=Kitasatospora sp. YST-16 TaxID=2998080 RepID=UPI00228495E4|nr:hypothetical protein [Kitasatospora sp. YST-16]WAL73120.1 hypothetical protein OU787_17370 [Kitasatospora sp. YST-16]WNW39174.1 hypothetical protein RKE32_17335 [Streptomyces sp. Li-HN-5-13]
MNFVKTHPARLYAVLVAVLALVAHYVPELPGALILAVAAAVLGTGEAVQRVENAKTSEAATAEPAETEDPYEV